MQKDWFWLPLVLIPVLVGWALRWLADGDQRTGQKGVVAYGTRAKVFAIAATAASAGLVSFIAARPRGPQDVAELPFIVLLFAALCGALLLEFFAVRMAFDQHGLRFWSPWSRRRALRWADLRSARWRQGFKYLDLDDGAKVVHLSVMLAGLDAFAEECLAHSPAHALSDPEVAAVLKLMRKGKAGALTFSEKDPCTLLSEVTGSSSG